jgi:hypothetical protein
MDEIQYKDFHFISLSSKDFRENECSESRLLLKGVDDTLAEFYMFGVQSG